MVATVLASYAALKCGLDVDTLMETLWVPVSMREVGGSMGSAFLVSPSSVVALDPWSLPLAPATAGASRFSPRGPDAEAGQHALSAAAPPARNDNARHCSRPASPTSSTCVKTLTAEA